MIPDLTDSQIVQVTGMAEPGKSLGGQSDSRLWPLAANIDAIVAFFSHQLIRHQICAPGDQWTATCGWSVTASRCHPPSPSFKSSWAVSIQREFYVRVGESLEHRFILDVAHPFIAASSVAASPACCCESTTPSVRVRCRPIRSAAASAAASPRSTCDRATRRPSSGCSRSGRRCCRRCWPF